MPVELIQQLPYRSDNTSLMLSMASLEMPAFLDSANYGGAAGRLDILAANPVAYLLKEAGVMRCSDPDIHSDNLDLFSCIRQLKDKYLQNSTTLDDAATELPFQGGLIGFIGYPTLVGKTQLDIGDCFVGVYLWAVVVDHVQQSSKLVFHPDCPAAEMARIGKLLKGGAFTNDKPADFALKADFNADLSRDGYDQAFEQIKQYIAAGDCYQVNLAQQFSAECCGDPFTAYLKLRHSTRAPFSAYMHWGSAALLSLSPERFLSLNGSAVLTQPIKGTRPRGEDADADAELATELLASEKDQAENLMIVDLLRNDLGRVCKTGSIEVNQLFELQSFSNVHHLVSSISGTLLTGCDGLNLLASCFPGGSITGAPKLRAMQIIQQLEIQPRRAYCGSVFYLAANGNMDSSITIRSLLWLRDDSTDGNHGEPRDRLLCWAGGGIVSDSESDAEYQECHAKIANIFGSLQS